MTLALWTCSGTTCLHYSLFLLGLFFTLFFCDPGFKLCIICGNILLQVFIYGLQPYRLYSLEPCSITRR